MQKSIKQKPSICILARKDLKRNTRIPRQTEALAKSGYDVVVYVLGKPNKHFICATKNCQYIVVGEHLFQKMKIVRVFILHFFIILSGCLKRKKASQKDIVPSVSSNTRKYIIRRFVCPFNYFFENLLFMFLTRLRAGNKQFEYVQAHDSLSLWAAWNLARSNGAKLIFDAVEIPYLLTELPQECFWKRIVKHGLVLESKILKRAHAILTVSGGLSKLMVVGYDISPPEIVRNCAIYEKERGSSIKDDLGLKPKDKLVLYLNSISPGRGLEQLIESLLYLPQNVHAAALGPEIPKGYLKTLIYKIRKNGLEERFHFLDMVAPNRVSSYSSAADIGVVPSQNFCLNIQHSLPNRVFEMIMARLPIAATSLPEIRQFVQKYGIGNVFDETDPQNMAHVIKQMLEPNNYCQYKSVVRQAANKLCWENESKKYTNILKRGNNESS